MIDAELLKTVAGLARLGLTPSESRSLQAELSTILEHFQAIQEVDTEGVEPLAHVMTAHGEAAEDVPEPFDDALVRLVPLAAVCFDELRATDRLRQHTGQLTSLLEPAAALHPQTGEDWPDAQHQHGCEQQGKEAELPRQGQQDG